MSKNPDIRWKNGIPVWGPPDDVPRLLGQPLDELELPECGAWGAWVQTERMRSQTKRD